MKSFRFWIAGALLILLSSGPVFAASTEGKKGLLEPGSPMPSFKLTDVVSGKPMSDQDFQGKKVMVVAFICRHCPYVQHVKQALARFGSDYLDKDVAIVAISSNDADVYPADGPVSLEEMARQEKFTFPFLFDGTQEVAKAFTAFATPDIFIFDAERKLVYRGQFDDTRPNGEESTGKDVREAVDALLAGQPLKAQAKPAIGCSIKWKPDNAPAYAK